MERTFRNLTDTQNVKSDGKTYVRVETVLFDKNRPHFNSQGVEWKNENGGKVRKETAEKLEAIYHQQL